MTGSIIDNAVRKAADEKFVIINMHRFFDAVDRSDNINEADWNNFKRHIRPLVLIPLPVTNLQLLIAKKDVQWSTEDITIFVGGSKNIQTILDFSGEEGEQFFDFNFELAKALIKSKGKPVQISLGYNPEDISSGHHSLLRLHTHLRRIGHPLDNSIVKPINLKTANLEEKLNLIEPFTPVFKDRLAHHLKRIRGWNDTILDEKTGYIRFTSDLDMYNRLLELFGYLQADQQSFEMVYADRNNINLLTLYDLEQRQKNLHSYLANSSVKYSKQSLELLDYFIKNLCQLGNGDIFLCDKDYRVHVSRGFVGGFNFTLAPYSDKLVIDFFPRLITRSGVSKTMLGTSEPVSGFEKSGLSATKKELAASEAFHTEVVDIVAGRFNNDQIFPLFNPITKEPTGYKLRSEVHADGDWHKGVQANILRKNDTGGFDILVQLRSDSVDIGKGNYDQSLAVQMTNVDRLSEAGAIKRGLKSELGITKTISIKRLDFQARIIKQYQYDRKLNNRELISLFLIEIPSETLIDIDMTKKVKALLWMEWHEFLEFFAKNKDSFTKTAQFYFGNKAVSDYIATASKQFMKDGSVPKFQTDPILHIDTPEIHESVILPENELEAYIKKIGV